MNDHKIKDHFEQLARKLKEEWKELTDDELKTAQASSEFLVSKLQERYGIRYDEARRQVRDFYTELYG
jgi:uncharacterized protein YjbJ (UPF0337 family)